VLAVALVLATRGAAAQPAGNMTLDVFRPALDARGYLTVNASQVLGDGELSFGLGALDWGHHLLRLDGNGASYSIDDMITATLVAAVGLRLGPAALELGASLPLRLMSGQRGPANLGDPATPNDDKVHGLDGQGMGNAGLHLKTQLVRAGRGAHVGLAAIASVYLPTIGANDRFLGETQLVPQLIGVVDQAFGRDRRLRLAVNAGIRLRRTTTFTDADRGPDMAPVTERSITAGSELPFGVAAAYAVAPQRLDLIGELFGARPLGAHQRYQPLEAIVGVKLYLARSSFLTLGAGRGLRPEQGANPEVRAFISIVFEPRAADRGGDALPEVAEREADPPAPPPSDRDGDGIPDALDSCPDEPEDFDGFEDGDGCPDPDNDGDRILDVDDLCPDEPETINGFEDGDGCPDRGVVERVGSNLLILQPINFEYDQAVIRRDSFYILDAVVATLAGSPDIAHLEVHGHTDERGDDRYNLALSERRAAAVVTYLVEHGVAAARLSSHGHGETEPLDRHHTPAAWTRNRRVELVVR
jgi:outer membrane protein OmpA-like peptidoglycan-associated protein